MHTFQNRRDFLAGLTASGTAGLIGMPSMACAEPPPETTTVRLPKYFPASCDGPLYFAKELLSAEGFTDVRYVQGDGDVDSSVWLARGEADFDFDYIPIHIQSIETGAPIKVLTGLHSGCLELIANESVKSINELKGRSIGVSSMNSLHNVLVTLMAAYIGLDPVNDIHWIVGKDKSALDLFVEGKIDAFLAAPPEPQELRSRKIGHTILDVAVDRPWSQYFCCMLAGHAAYVDKYPVATKRVMRALLKAVDLCASKPKMVAQQLVDDKFTNRYDYTLETLNNSRYDRWREFDPEDTMRFYALRMQEVGFIKTDPNTIIAKGTDWRFLNELKRELKT
jgi:NitT/TauT family transport system substrate-binding protein